MDFQVLDGDALDAFLIAAVEHYDQSAPRVSAWADDLYRRIFGLNTPETVTLAEIIAALRLHTDGQWEPANFAQNRIYHALDRWGQDTTGWLDF